MRNKIFYQHKLYRAARSYLIWRRVEKIHEFSTQFTFIPKVIFGRNNGGFKDILFCVKMTQEHNQDSWEQIIRLTKIFQMSLRESYCIVTCDQNICFDS
jgi:hypothetical protein